jgi:signal transduction histidine kinase
LKSPEYVPGSARPADEQRDEEGKVADENNVSGTNSLPSGRDEEQNRDDSEKAVAEERKIDDLIQMGRHLAHQLNNLLTTILTNTQLMLLIAKDEELKPYLRIVEDATHDAGVVVRGFQESIRGVAGLSSQEKISDKTRQPDI